MKKLVVAIGNFLSIIAFFYTIWYTHFGVPYKNSGALSKIGLTHHTYFAIWGILTVLALGLNTIIAYKKYTKTKIYIPLLLIATIGMVLTLCFDFDFDKKPDYYLHCAGSLTFSAIMGITIFILFMLCYKNGGIFKAFTFITAGILIVDLICLLIFKETALIEVLPIFAGYLLLGIANTRRDRIEAKR
jgi:hypothetical protein